MKKDMHITFILKECEGDFVSLQERGIVILNKLRFEALKTTEQAFMLMQEYMLARVRHEVDQMKAATNDATN